MKAQTIVMACTLSALAPFGAGAATIQQTLSFSGSTVEFDQTVGGFDYFDLAGTLDSVTLSYDATASGTVRAQGCRNTPGCQPATFALVLSGTGPFGAVSDADSASSGIVSTTNGTQIGSYAVSVADTLDLAVADFVGSGTFGALRFLGDYAGRFTAVSGTFSGTVTLTYDYSVAAVPLPASLPLALGALGLLGLHGRRRAA